MIAGQHDRGETFLAQRVKRLFVLVALIFILGVAGYHSTEGASPFDALYMTVITIGGVGYDETIPLSKAGRAFTMLLILFGVCSLALAISTMTSAYVDTDIRSSRRRKKLMKTLERLQDHCILCGAGRTGMPIIEDFLSSGRPIVVIDQDEKHAETLREYYPRLPVLVGNSLDDDVLRAANIGSARSLVAALSADTDNLYVVLSARALNPNIIIVARAFDKDANSKMLRAGASYVVCPNMMGGLQMSSLILRPSVLSFLETVTSPSNGTILMESVEVRPESELVQTQIDQATILQRTGLNLVAIKQSHPERDEVRLINGCSSTTVSTNDVLIVLGEPEKIAALRTLAGC